MEKGNVIMKYYLAIIKKEILPYTTAWIKIEAFVLSEISQVENGKYSLYTYIWNLSKINK